MSGLVARFTTVALVALAVLGVAAPAASADRRLDPAGIKLEVLDSAGNPANRAGAHPDRFITRLTALPGETGRDIEIGFPPGMSGDPRSVPTCSRAAYDDPSEAGCPADTQVGVMRILKQNGTEDGVPIFNLDPAPDEVASFGGTVAFLRFKFSGRLRPGDLGLTTLVRELPQEVYGVPPVETIFEFWGVPADHQVGTSIPRRAFLTNPTRCDRGPLTINVRQRSWEQSDEWGAGTSTTGVPLVGCETLPFAPTVAFGLDNPVADAPTGLALDLKFPEAGGADAPVSSQVSGSTIAFPAGMGFSAGAAGRLRACSDVQLARGSDAPATCPASSRVGSVEIGAPQLSAPLSGTVYLGEEHPNDRFRLFIVAAGAGIETKFVGSMRPDPVTGRLTAVLADLPELALGNLLMRFDGGSRALFAAPGCGPARVDATITPYSGNPPTQASDSITVAPRPGQRCGDRAPFAPTLAAAMSATRGGQPTSFSAVISRRDGEGLTDRFSLVFPPGLSAGLGSVDLCPAAAAATGACPAASRIGNAFVAAGSGPETAEFSGDAFLTGPYRGNPFGVALTFDAKVGPFNLGSFVVRAGMEMDPLSGQVSVQTDSMPQSFQGIPVRIQTLGLEIDRPGFMRAPTSCTTKQVASTIVSTENAVARPTSDLSLSGCVDLPFRPSFALALTDRSQLHRQGRPGMRITMGSKPGEANMRSAAIVLPTPLRFNAGGLTEVCARRDAFRGACSKRSRVGSGFGRTPLLKEPLKGGIYVVQPKGAGEPDLWTSLEGQGIELNLRSLSALKDGHLETRFQDLPDTPLSSFTMRFDGGESGVLSLRRDLCVKGKARHLSAPTTLEGHNGAQRRLRIPVTTPEFCKAR